MEFLRKINLLYAICLLLKSPKDPHPKYTMSSPVLTIAEGTNMKKQNKTKIGVGSAVKAQYPQQ